MKLPELSADASPEFTDAATCKEWLEHVPLANVATAQANLLEQLQEFNRFPAAAAPRLAVLEGLREAVHFVQIEQAKRFANRALPMSEQEKAAFDTTIALWDQMCAGYQRCLDGAINRDSGMRAQAALVCQRLLAYIGLRMFHHYRAYRQVSNDDWRALHETYAAAEKLDVAEDAVKDFLNRDIQDTSPRVAYLAGDACPERGTTASTTPPRAPRYLDTRKLSKSLRNRVALLRKGESPAKLALGEDCVQPCGEQTELTQKQREEIATFGRVSTREDDDYSNAHGFAVEQWYVEDESSQGMRMVRKAKEPGKRLAHGQLIGVRPGDGKQFMLAQVRWLMGADNGDLHAGVKLLPGLPSPLAVRPTGLNVQQDSWVPALALSAVPALESPPSLVLPHGWFKPKRIVELYAERSSKAMLTEVIERGVDFERVAFQPVP